MSNNNQPETMELNKVSKHPSVKEFNKQFKRNDRNQTCYNCGGAYPHTSPCPARGEK